MIKKRIFKTFFDGLYIIKEEKREAYFRFIHAEDKFIIELLTSAKQLFKYTVYIEEKDDVQSLGIKSVVVPYDRFLKAYKALPASAQLKLTFQNDGLHIFSYLKNGKVQEEILENDYMEYSDRFQKYISDKKAEIANYQNVSYLSKQKIGIEALTQLQYVTVQQIDGAILFIATSGVALHTVKVPCAKELLQGHKYLIKPAHIQNIGLMQETHEPYILELAHDECRNTFFRFTNGTLQISIPAIETASSIFENIVNVPMIDKRTYLLPNEIFTKEITDLLITLEKEKRTDNDKFSTYVTLCCHPNGLDLNLHNGTADTYPVLELDNSLGSTVSLQPDFMKEFLFSTYDFLYLVKYYQKNLSNKDTCFKITETDTFNILHVDNIAIVMLA